jgi:hypothetical protein
LNTDKKSDIIKIGEIDNREVLIMLIGSVGLNSIANQVGREGYQAAHAISKKAASVTKVSNFGGETKIGTSDFQQANRKAVADGQAATAANMRDVKETIKQFSTKMSYTKNATLEAIRQNTLDIYA